MTEYVAPYVIIIIVYVAPYVIIIIIVYVLLILNIHTFI